MQQLGTSKDLVEARRFLVEAGILWGELRPGGHVTMPSPQYSFVYSGLGVSDAVGSVLLSQHAAANPLLPQLRTAVTNIDYTKELP